MMHDPKNQINLRRQTPLDEDFSRRLHHCLHAPGFAAAGLAPEALEQLLDMQFRTREAAYAHAFAAADRWIIERAGQPVGAFIFAICAGRARLADIGVLPEWRGHGIATAVIAWMQARAAEMDLPLDLEVSPLNPAAQRLYARLGFVAGAAAGVSVPMRWLPPRPGGVRMPATP